METEEKKIQDKEDILVIKIGSSIILNEGMRAELFDQINQISKKVKVVLVVSGAVGFGKKEISEEEMIESGITDKTEQNQVWASEGQIALIQTYRKGLQKRVAQVLINHADLSAEKISVIEKNLKLGSISAINENDSTATKELNVGDNDQLAAHTAAQLQKTGKYNVRLIALTESEGVFGRNRETIQQINICKISKKLQDFFIKHCIKKGTNSGRGGILPKIIAAIRASHNGVNTSVGHPKDLLNIFLNNSSEQNWTNFLGTLSDEQIERLEQLIRENNLDIPEFEYS